MMASEETAQGQEVTKCDLCNQLVSFFCRRCGVNLCDPCVLIHLRVKAKFGHDVVDFANKDDDDSCLCNTHPKHECSAYCETCDLPICLLCVSIKHKSHEMSDLHDKIEELLEDIAKENNRLQSFRHELERIMNHATKQLSYLSSVYKKVKDEVTARGEEWHKLIDNHVKKLHQELDDLKKDNDAILQKQKRQFEEIIGKIDESNSQSTQLQKSKNLTQIQKFKPVNEEQKIITEIAQYLLPSFINSEIDETQMQTYFGYIAKNPEMIISQFEKKSISGNVLIKKVLEVPSETSVIDTGFPADEDDNNRLYDMAVTDDEKVWMGGHSETLKLFDLQGNLQRTVNITYICTHICMLNKQVVFSCYNDNTIKKISDDDTVVTMFTTGEWIPYGIIGSASGDLLACLRKDDQSKVVRYSSIGNVLQEIQYDSQRKPLFQWAVYIAENVNGDIIVTDFKRNVVTTTNTLGIFHYSYSGIDNSFDPYRVTTDSIGHVFVADYVCSKIHMLDGDGRFLRYIIPEGGIERPRAVCMIGDGGMIVGECNTGLAKIIKFIKAEK